jgi:hypothetical protein
LFDAFQRVGGSQLGPVLGREQIESDQVSFGRLEQIADLRCGGLQAFQDMPDSLTSRGLVFGVEDLSEGGGDEAALVAAAVGEHVADEVHRAPLPRAGETRAIACLSPSC